MQHKKIIQPIRGVKGATAPGPRNLLLDEQNPDVLVPPETDHGSLPNLKFSFSLAHNRLEEGGWAREVTVREFPVSKSMAGVDMRLDEGAVRELHWHKEAEWGFVLQGKARFTVVDPSGSAFIDDLTVGDMWFAPAGIPHSIQGLEGGCEFLLVFDDGNFSENETLLVTEFIAHMPQEVLSKNFDLDEAIFENMPKSEKYIFRQPVPRPLEEVVAPFADRQPKQPYTYHASQQELTQYSGGKAKVVDSRQFPITTLSALIMEIEPGGMRELHWHPDADEWQYYLQGNARMTVFDATNKARTFNYTSGDVGFVPRTLGHYIENTGDTTLRVLNVFNNAFYSDLSLNNWLALTPPDLVKEHLDVGDEFIRVLRKTRDSLVKKK